jgi:hypothetical protein
MTEARIDFACAKHGVTEAATITVGQWFRLAFRMLWALRRPGSVADVCPSELLDEIKGSK